MTQEKQADQTDQHPLFSLTERQEQKAERIENVVTRTLKGLGLLASSSWLIVQAF